MIGTALTAGMKSITSLRQWEQLAGNDPLCTCPEVVLTFMPNKFHLWPPKFTQFILESEWTLVPNWKKFSTKRSGDIVWTKTGQIYMVAVTIYFDLWPPKFAQSNWTCVPNLKKFPQGLPEILLKWILCIKLHSVRGINLLMKHGY